MAPERERPLKDKPQNHLHRKNVYVASDTDLEMGVNEL